LAPWEVGRRALPEKTAALAAMADDPGQAARAEQIEKDILAYINDFSVPLVDAARRGNSMAASREVSLDGERRMEALRHGLDDYSRIEYQLSDEQQTRADQTYRQSTLLVAGGATVCVIAIAVITGYLSRAVVRPVRRTARMAQRLAGGDLGARVPETGRGEIAVLEHSFNSMAMSLERGRDELARVNDEQAALRRVATLVANGSPSSEVFSAVSRESGLILGAEVTRLLRFEADGRPQSSAPGVDRGMRFRSEAAFRSRASLPDRYGRQARLPGWSRSHHPKCPPAATRQWAPRSGLREPSGGQ
jgi:HAMP domain-containing protein